MNKKELKQINNDLTEKRNNIKFQNVHLQQNMVEQFELSMCKMFEYIKDQSDFLKLYLNGLSEMEQNDLSPVLLDGMHESIIQAKKEVTIIRRAYEDAKIDLKKNDNIEELNIIIFHSTELNEMIRMLYKIENILFSYPPNKD